MGGAKEEGKEGETGSVRRKGERRRRERTRKRGKANRERKKMALKMGEKEENHEGGKSSSIPFVSLIALLRRLAR